MKQKKQGIVVRLIDIVLILLFGFITISTLDSKSDVRLSETTDMRQTNVDKEEILVIGIPRKDVYRVEGIKKDANASGLEIQGLENITAFIEGRNNIYLSRKKKMKVRLRVNWYLPIKYAMNVALFCDKKGIEKAIDVRIVSKKK